MAQTDKYITRFRVKGLWGRLNIKWDNVYNDVNIIVGINGCGKTTLLNLISDFYSGQKIKKYLAESIEGNDVCSNVKYIQSFDIPTGSKKKTSESLLLQELKMTVNQNGEGTSFFDYRMKMLNFPEEASKIQQRITRFFNIINHLFEETGKEISIDPQNNTLIFSIKKTGGKVLLEQLSSGEKQLLLILTTVFLQEEKPSILLMDEPEISLHINWQDCLISTIRELNPNCQIILTTHSPNIFANGWEDKIVFMQDLETE